MSLDLSQVSVSGPALTLPFLSQALAPPSLTSTEQAWRQLCASLRPAPAQRVHTSMTHPLLAALGYDGLVRQAPVRTRDGAEDGGWLAQHGDAMVRVWSVEAIEDPARATPRTVRAHPMRVAQRVLSAKAERCGLLVGPAQVRLLLCDPFRSHRHITIETAAWRTHRVPPDEFRLLLALAGAAAVPQLPAVLDAARLYQTQVTRDLHRQAQAAMTGFINALPDRSGLTAKALWHETLVLVYRLIFILKMDHPDGFSFATTSLWMEAFSPNRRLATLVRRHLDQGHATGRMLEDGLRRLFAALRDGLTCDELSIAPLGGALFGTASMSALDALNWGEAAVAILLDCLMWTRSTEGARVRVHYGALSVEELGHIYESLLEQEPMLAAAPRRQGAQDMPGPAGSKPEEIAPGTFFLRAGLRRKATGSFYTPQEFVHFIVRETITRKAAELSPPTDPQPARLLTLRVLDPAMGSGHFLVEACRTLGEALLQACRLADERGLHDRITAMPDAAALVPYLPSHGWAETKARAICRRLVAVHCLYGCDRNPLAVQLARLALWIESYAEGLPLTFLDHRLIEGDALTGPFFADLATLPVTGGPLDPLLAAGVHERLDAALTEGRRLARALDASLGHSLLDLDHKQALKQQRDAVLAPLRSLAQAWSGATLDGGADADDVWLALARQVADTGVLPVNPPPRARTLLATGAESICWDLAFPEVADGFGVVLGNPPWDVVLPNTADFLAMLEGDVETGGLAQPDIAALQAQYRAGFDNLKRIVPGLYQHQHTKVRGARTAGSLDLFRLFAERAVRLTAADGSIGLLLPSAFHTNEGTTALRQLYLKQTALDWCLSFENRRRLFDIDSRFRFDVVIARRPGPTQRFRCGFYLERIEDADRAMTYDMPFLIASGGPNLTFPDLRGPGDLAIARRLFAAAHTAGTWCAERGISFGRDLHMTGDAALLRPPGQGDLVLHEGKTFHQFTTRWETQPRYSVASGTLTPLLAERSRHQRLVFRDIARATDERTMIACIAPSGTIFGHTATPERTPASRRLTDALILCAVFNAFSFDWLVRLKVGTHLSLFLLRDIPMPTLTPAQEMDLAVISPQLPECLGSARGQALRAQADAIVARAYGLTRAAYANVLASFSHRTWPEATTQCLTAFDALGHAAASQPRATPSACKSPY